MKAGARSRALLVGVPKTTWLDGQLAELPGVEVDVQRMADFLSREGFDATVVCDPVQPTADRVRSELAKIVDATEAGDLSVIYLSGHGYRIPDEDGVEIDTWDEVFVCADGPIVDDWFRDRLWNTSQPASSMVVVVDACHSATSVLEAFPDLRRDHSPIVRAVRSTANYRLVLSACADEEVSLQQSPTVGSVVTNEMLGLLAEQRGRSYRELWTTLADLVPARFSAAGRPQLDTFGPDDRLVDSVAFGTTLRPI